MATPGTHEAKARSAADRPTSAAGRSDRNGRADRAPYRKSGAVRGAILTAARELFSQRLPADVSVRDIAVRAGVQHSLVHRHFGNKEQLHAAVLASVINDYAATVAVAADPTEGFRVALDHLVCNHVVVLATATAVVSGSDTNAGQFPGFDRHVEQVLAAGAADDEHTRLVVAVAVAVVTGWSFLEDRWFAAAGIQSADRDGVRDEVVGMIGRLLRREASIEQPPT